jgi:hypothetical protein
MQEVYYTLKSGCRLEQLQLETAEECGESVSDVCDCRLAVTVANLRGAKLSY